MSREAAVAHAHPPASALRVGVAVGAVVLAAVVVFGLGVMVGKRVAESAPPVAPPPAAMPTEPPPAPAAAMPSDPPAADQLTFYDRLSGAATAAPVDLPDGEAPPTAPGARPADRAAASAAVAAPAPAPAPTPRTDGTPGAAARIRKLAGKGRFTVQVASVSDRAAAEAAAARVRGEGFDAVTATVSIKGRTWYRIRAGRFPTKQAAIQAAGIFSSAYGFKAIAVQD